jgi:hypothetical protein
MMVQVSDAAEMMCCCRGTERLLENEISAASAASGDLNKEMQVGDMIREPSVDVRRGKALSLLVVQA